jgi:hypothetical protein
MDERHNREAWKALGSIAEWATRQEMGDALYDLTYDEEGNRREVRLESESALRRYVAQQEAEAYEDGWLAGYAAAAGRYETGRYWDLYGDDDATAKSLAQEAWGKGQHPRKVRVRRQ